MREVIDNFLDWLGEAIGPQFDNLQFELEEGDLREDLAFGRDRLALADLHWKKPSSTLH